MIPHEYIEELTRRTDIVELVGSYVQLKRKGRLYGGLCPFHSEKSPSFYVYPDTQSFYCFGCGAGGDAITFAKKINSIDYVEAVKLLAGTEAILLDPVYSGKAMAGLIDLVRKGHFPEGANLLFLHTGGSPALFAYLDTFRK